jgi:hypothetical protein
MKRLKILIAIFLLFNAKIFSQTLSPAFQRILAFGYQWNGGQFDKVLNPPAGLASDTLQLTAEYKRALRAGSVFYDTANHLNFRWYAGSWHPEPGGGGSSQVQSDWAETNTSLLSFIKNKPTLAQVAYSGLFFDLSGRPTTLNGYGITDAVPFTRTLTINGVSYDLSQNRSWTVTGTGTGGPDTVVLSQQGTGFPMLGADGTLILKTRTILTDYGILADTAKTGHPLNFVADTSSPHGLVSKDRLAALGIFSLQNLGTGFRVYKPGQGNRTFFTDYGSNWDSTKNTNGLTLVLDTTKLATRAYVDGHGGPGGSGGPDTVTLNQLGTGIPMLKANGTPTLDTRTVTADYGILTDTSKTGKPLNIAADTSSANGLVSKPRLNAVVISASGHPKPSYGTRVNLDSVRTDTFRVKATEVGPMKMNDPTFDNAPTITAAIALAYSLHKDVELPTDTIWLKSYFTLLPGVSFWSAGKQTVFKGNYTSDHYLISYNSSSPLYNVDFNYITFDRRGPNTSHGTMFGNAHYMHFNYCKWIDNDTTAAGGALGISCFSPWATYPSDHIWVNHCEFIGSGNFAFQWGNADWVYADYISGFRNSREFIGAEAYNLGGENGKTRHAFISNALNYNPDNTVQNGSQTGIYIVTGSSGGVMDDINLTDCVDSGGNVSSMHGFNVLTGYNVTLTRCRSVSTGGWGFQVTSSAFGESRFVHLIDCYARNNGRDGTRTAGLRVHDTQYSDFDITSEGNVDGILEDGTSQLNRFYKGNVMNNAVPYIANTGRPHRSSFIGLVVDSTGSYNLDVPSLSVGSTTIPTGNVSTDNIATLGPVVNGTQTFRQISPSAIGGGGGTASIPPNIGGGFRIYSPQVPGYKGQWGGYGTVIDSITHANALTWTVDTNLVVSKTFINNYFGDTAKYSLEKVMANSSVLTTGHVVYHIGHDYYFYGGPKNPVKLGNGAMFVNQGLFGTTQSNPVGSLQFVDSAGGGVGEHLWYRGNRTAPYDLLAAAAGGPYFNDFAIIDSGGQHIGFKLRFSDGSYANKIIFPYAAGSTGGGGSSFTLTTTGTSGPATFSGGVLNIPQYPGGGGGSGTSAGFLGDLQYSDGAGGFLSGAMNYSSTQTSLNVPHYASNGASAFITSRGTNVSSGSTANGTDVTTEFTVVTTGAVSGTLINYSYNTATNGRPFAVISASNAATATAISALFVETLTSTTGRIGFSCASAGTYKVTIHTDFF